MDLVKFAMKATVIKYLQAKTAAKAAEIEARGYQTGAGAGAGGPITRTLSRHESLYSNRTSFLNKTKRRVLGNGRASMSAAEQERFR